MSENQNEDLDISQEEDYGTETEGTEENDIDGVEAQARSLGWKPEEEFKGDPNKWTDATTFLSVHERNNGALRKANEKLSAEMAELRRSQEGLTKAQKQIFEFQLNKAKEEHSNQLAFLKAQRKEALREGQHEMAAELEDQIDAAKERGPDLKELPEIPESNTKPQEPDWRENPKLVAFVERNPWIETNEDLAAVVVARAKKIKETNLGITLEDLLDQAVETTKRAFPEKFGQTTRRASVEGATPGATSGNARAQTYQALPKEARDMCDDFVADKVMTKEQYVKMYFEADNTRKAR